MAAVINFLSVDAQLPLDEGGEVNFKSSAGFKKAPATLEPGSVLMTAETYCALLIRRGFTPLVSGERCPRVEGIAVTV